MLYITWPCTKFDLVTGRRQTKWKICERKKSKKNNLLNLKNEIKLAGGILLYLRRGLNIYECVLSFLFFFFFPLQQRIVNRTHSSKWVQLQKLCLVEGRGRKHAAIGDILSPTAGFFTHVTLTDNDSCQLGRFST